MMVLPVIDTTSGFKPITTCKHAAHFPSKRKPFESYSKQKHKCPEWVFQSWFLVILFHYQFLVQQVCDHCAMILCHKESDFDHHFDLLISRKKWKKKFVTLISREKKLYNNIWPWQIVDLKKERSLYEPPRLLSNIGFEDTW